MTHLAALALEAIWEPMGHGYKTRSVSTQTIDFFSPDPSRKIEDLHPSINQARASKEIYEGCSLPCSR